MARVEHAIDLKNSYIVGDKTTDMLLARAVSAKGVLVKTGQEQTSAHADYIADNLTQAADWIVRNHENTHN